MILREETFKKFGYYSNELSRCSHKKVIARCEKCGITREIQYGAYRDLCVSCAHKGFKFSEEHNQKISKARIGKQFSERTKQKIQKARLNMTIETKQKMSSAHEGSHHTIETKQKMSEAHSGEKCYAWKGGISFEPYCIKFNNEFKERVREYWNRKCMNCGKSEFENGRKLSVHHVNYNKDACCDDSLPLFIPLCASCHAKTNTNREYWKDKFKRIIYSRNIGGECYYIKKDTDIK